MSECQDSNWIPRLASASTASEAVAGFQLRLPALDLCLTAEGLRVFTADCAGTPAENQIWRDIPSVGANQFLLAVGPPNNRRCLRRPATGSEFVELTDCPTSDTDAFLRWADPIQTGGFPGSLGIAAEARQRRDQHNIGDETDEDRHIPGRETSQHPCGHRYPLPVNGLTLSRGTTDGYAGGRAVLATGITPASTDPAVATAHAILRKSTVTQLYIERHPRTSLALPGSRRPSDPLNQIPVDLPPSAFARRASRTISASRARTILGEMGVSVLGQIADFGVLTQRSHSVTPMTSTQISEFLRGAAQ